MVPLYLVFPRFTSLIFACSSQDSAYPKIDKRLLCQQAVPRAAQNQITAELVAQTTAALRGLNYDKQNWRAVFNASGDITAMLPYGSTFTGPLPRPWQYNLRAIAYPSGSNTRISANSEAGSSSRISGLGFINGHGNVVVARVGNYD